MTLQTMTQEQCLKDANAENEELNEKIEEERQSTESVRNELIMLQVNRYIVDEEQLAQSSDQRLGDIEMQLYRSIQQINMEKGKRQVLATLGKTAKDIF